MPNNVGSFDKSIRILLTIIIAGLGIYYQSWLGLIAAIPFFTVVSGWCPLYSIIGVTTCSVKK